MIDRDRTTDLWTLADMFWEHIDYQRDGGLGLDAKRPFGFSGPIGYDILERLGVPKDADENAEDEWSDEQLDYADGLWVDLKDFLVGEWAKHKDASGRGG